MNQTTALRLFLGVLILIAPAALYFVNAIAAWAVLAIVAGTLVARKRGARSTGGEGRLSSAAYPSTLFNA